MRLSQIDNEFHREDETETMDQNKINFSEEQKEAIREFKQNEEFSQANRVSQINNAFSICRTLSSNGVQFSMNVNHQNITFTFIGVIHIRTAVRILSTSKFGERIVKETDRADENRARLVLSW